MNTTRQKMAPKLNAPTKQYRVVLEAIDPHKETKESFALKLSMQVRTPITRVNSIVKNLPYSIKNGLSLEQAKRFSAVLEELGGIVTVVEYVVKAGESHPAPETQWTPASRNGDSDLSKSGARGLKSEDGKTVVCKHCGWENSGEVDFCAFCFASFRNRQVEVKTLTDRLPEENPLLEKSKFEAQDKELPAKRRVSDRQFYILGVLGLLLIWLVSRL